MCIRDSNNLISIDIDLSVEMKGVKIKARIMDGDSVLAEKSVKQHEMCIRDSFVALSPHELYERKVTMQELHAAISSLPDKQAKRMYAHFILGMTKQLSLIHI